MNTGQLTEILSTNCLTKDYFTGVFSIDTLITIKKDPRLAICNTDPSYKPGKHWVLFFFDNDVVDYFDSLGRNPEYYGSEFVAFMETFASHYNICLSRVQPMNTPLCGHYCTWFAILRCKKLYYVSNN